MDYFPLFLRLHGQAVVLIGGGSVAARKVMPLIAAGARVTVVAPTLTASLRTVVDAGTAHWLEARFAPQQLDGARLVVAATGDHDVNAAVAAAATARGIWVNAVDDLEHSSAIMPAIVDRSPILVAISSGGAAPVLATDIRGRIEAMLDHSVGTLARLAARLRAVVGARIRDNDQRRRFWRLQIDGPVAQSVRDGRIEIAEQQLLAALEVSADVGARGRVLLVGAGPGDPGLLTLRAHRALQDADVVLYDRLVAPEILAMGRRDAQWIEVGKRHGQADAIQHDIAQLLVEHARNGKIVVRLKGGDPMLFARIEEELQVLIDNDIAFEIVPGITSASACAAYAGIPLTARDSADAVRLITAAHCQNGREPDWPCLARSNDTIVIYMGVASIGQTARELIRHGRLARTPVAIIENGSRSNQRVIVTTLIAMESAALNHNVIAPALLVIGDQAQRALRFGWFGAQAIDARALATALKVAA